MKMTLLSEKAIIFVPKTNQKQIYEETYPRFARTFDLGT